MTLGYNYRREGNYELRERERERLQYDGCARKCFSLLKYSIYLFKKKQKTVQQNLSVLFFLI